MSLRTILEELSDFDTALLANTIGYIEPTPPHEYYMGGSIHSLTPSIEPTVGVAFTCELDSSSPGPVVDTDEYKQKLEGFHANCEGVIRIPSSCLEILAGKATRMHAFEHDAHRVMRRTDLAGIEKSRRVTALLDEWGFGAGAKCAK